MHCTAPPSMLLWGWSELLPICLALYRHCIREEGNGARAGLYVLRQVRLTPLKSFQQRCALTQHHIRVIFYDMFLSSLFWPLARHCHFDPPAVWEPCNFGRAWQPGSGQPYSNMPSDSVPRIFVCFPLDVRSDGLVDAWVGNTRENGFQRATVWAVDVILH